MSNPPPQPPSNGGEFLLSLLQKSQTPPQPQAPQHLAQHPFTTDPAIAAVGPALLFPSPPPPPQVQHQPPLWHDLTPPPPSGGYFTNSVLVPGSQFPGVNYGFEVLGDGAVGQQQGEQRLMFGSIPSGIGRYEGLVNGNLLGSSGKERESGSRIGGFNGFDRNIQFGDRGRLKFGSGVSGYQGIEQERMGNGWEYQSRSPDMRMPPPGFQRRQVDVGNLDLGDKRGFMEDNEMGRGNGLSYGMGLGKEQNKGVRKIWSDDGKKVGEQGLSGQLDRPGPPAGSNLRSILSSDMEDDMEDALIKLRTGAGGDGKGDRRAEVDEDIDDLGEEMVDSLLLEDESDNKNDKKQHRKEFRSDPRGQHMLSQRVRISKRQMHCRPDIERLNVPFIKLYESLIPDEEQKAKQKQLLMSLEKVVLNEWPHARLYVYGSCANSFGVSKSDIDVCLAFGDVDINKSEVLLKLAKMLESNNLQNVQPLTRARVPIVKLMDPVTGLSCDICINNVLAVVNTKLLRDYAQIDVRLHQLAFIVKHWAKCRGVNETYQGTLSSYAYVLMCIDFLQRRKPAILPCLQGMNATYSVTVDGIQCAYFDQVEKLRSFGSRNKESIAQLLWGFFNYWAFCHDYAKSVISIRRGSIISKHEKDWTKRVGNDRHLICIEDPFETSHDLGRVVDRKSIRVLREEFERAADIMQYDPHPFATLFEPYT